MDDPPRSTADDTTARGRVRWWANVPLRWVGAGLALLLAVAGLVYLAGSATPLTCDDFASCDIRAGRCGSTVRRVEFARALPKGQPRDLEIRVAVRWKGDVLVDATLNNAVALYHGGSPIPAHTGQNPPPSLAQLADFAQEPALNVITGAAAATCP